LKKCDDIQTDSNYLHYKISWLQDSSRVNKKLSCHRETARRFVSLNIFLSHSRSLEMTPLC